MIIIWSSWCFSYEILWAAWLRPQWSSATPWTFTHLDQHLDPWSGKATSCMSLLTVLNLGSWTVDNWDLGLGRWHSLPGNRINSGCKRCIYIYLVFRMTWSLGSLDQNIRSAYCITLYVKCSNGLKPPTIVGILRVLNCWVSTQHLWRQPCFILGPPISFWKRRFVLKIIILRFHYCWLKLLECK